MNTISRTITGIVAIAFGLFLSWLGVAKDPWVLIYGVPIVIIGLFIFFNKKEDEIEEIKSKKDLED